MNDRIRQRWQDRRNKNHNWKKLIIMVIALILIILAMNELGKQDRVVFQAEPDTTRSESVKDSLTGDAQ
ncbi:MAG: hypothetical protein FJ042_00930 [Candidatus Cloacimonetes bacterium]|nr:hypothetical protein [Candidatus Cloacimonadota bacterium]